MVQMQVGHGTPVTIYDSSDQELGTTVNPINVEGTVTEAAPAATALTTAQVTVSATEVLLLPLDTARLGATLANNSGITIYLGPTGVSATNGLIVPTGGSYNIDFPNYTGAVYGLAASGNPVISRAILK